MFNNSGLSMEQAPPIKVVLRFFLTGSVFGIIAGIMLFFSNDINNIYSAQTLIITHTLTLGVMASFMFGALFQMLPVLAGVHIKAPVKLSMRINYALIFGTLFLLLAFYNGAVINYIFAMALLGFALFATSYIMVRQLLKIKHSASSKGMLLSLLTLSLVAIFGIIMLLERLGIPIGLNYLHLKEIHFSFGVFGWIAMLIISVSFQVIEMFYVTPPYPKIYAKYMPLALFLLLLLNILSAFFAPKLMHFIQTAAVLAVAVHAVLTLMRLKQKKRAVTDATILFWALAMVSYLLFTATCIANLFITVPPLLTASFFALFALGTVFAMVYKIVPFLVWFHLNAQGYFDAPMMHEIASAKYARINLYLFSSLLILVIFTSFSKFFCQLVSIILIISFFMLFYMMYRGWHKYLYVLKNGKKFEFNMPNL